MGRKRGSKGRWENKEGDGRKGGGACAAYILLLFQPGNNDENTSDSVSRVLRLPQLSGSLVLSLFTATISKIITMTIFLHNNEKSYLC